MAGGRSGGHGRVPGRALGIKCTGSGARSRGLGAGEVSSPVWGQGPEG